MAWDASASMDRLQRTLQSIREMKQRKNESNRAMFSDLLGKGMDVWKTLSEPKRAEAARLAQWGPEGSGPKQLGEESKVRQEEMRLQYKLEWDQMVAASGLEDIQGDKEFGRRITELQTQFALQMQAADKAADREDARQRVQNNFTKELQALQNDWDLGAEAGLAKGAHEYRMEEIGESGAQQRQTDVEKSAGPEAIQAWNMLLESAWTQAQAAGLVKTDEMGREVIPPENLAAFRGYFVIPEGLDARIASYIQKRIDSFDGTKTEDAPIVPPPPSGNGAPTVDETEWVSKITSVMEKAKALAAAGDPQAKGDMALFANVLLDIQKPKTSWYLSPQDVPPLQDVKGWQDKAKKFQEAYLRYIGGGGSRSGNPASLGLPAGW